jgi:hypothetical protein
VAAAAVLVAAGFVADGQTREETIRATSGALGDRLVTTGGRGRFALPGTDIRATVGPRTVCLYRRAGREVTFLGEGNYRTTNFTAEQLREALGSGAPPPKAQPGPLARPGLVPAVGNVTEPPPSPGSRPPARRPGPPEPDPSGYLFSARRAGFVVSEPVLALRALALHRWTAEQLAQELGHDVRTTYRLLTGIEAAGVPVVREREGRRVYIHVARQDLAEALGLRG